MRTVAVYTYDASDEILACLNSVLNFKTWQCSTSPSAGRKVCTQSTLRLEHNVAVNSGRKVRRCDAAPQGSLQRTVVLSGGARGMRI